MEQLFTRSPEKKHGDPFFSAKIKYAAQEPDMVKPTFFLWEIIQKLLFLALGFSYPGNSKQQFLPSWGSQWGPGGRLAHFGPKKAIFEQFSIKFYFFLLFKIFLYFKTIKKFI